MNWECFGFNELSVESLYAVMRLRQEVFVVEQECAYLDADGLDVSAWHLTGTLSGRLVAYLRILPPGARYHETSIGRTVVAQDVRGRGLGRALMLKGLEEAEQRFPTTGVRISAQAHLAEFYAGLSFERVGGEYLEDGIRHIEMYRAPADR